MKRKNRGTTCFTERGAVGSAQSLRRHISVLLRRPFRDLFFRTALKVMALIVAQVLYFAMSDEVEEEEFNLP